MFHTQTIITIFLKLKVKDLEILCVPRSFSIATLIFSTNTQKEIVEGKTTTRIHVVDRYSRQEKTSGKQSEDLKDDRYSI